MTLQRQLGIWALALLALILFLWVFSPILLPFIAGLVLAYFLDPVADWMERLGIPRLAATCIILALSVVGLALIFLLLFPVLGDQIGKLAGNLPSYLKSLLTVFDQLAPGWVKDQLARSGTDIQGSLSGIAGSAAGWAGALLASIWSGGLALVNIVSLLVVTPVVAFYLLNDWDRMVARVDSWLPREHVETIRGLAHDIDEAMAGFIRGQGTVCLVLGVLYAAALSIFGLNFGLLIGLGAGFLSFIPFVGSILGGAIALGVAAVQYWPDWVSILIVLAIFAAGQFIEGNILSPRLVGDRIGLHPVWLMFALLAFGYLFGFVGLLLAVPLAAASGVLIRFGLKRYLHSRLFLGDDEKRAEPPPLDLKRRRGRA